ncbi:MAG: carbon-nitrogen hydrolase [Gemmatimonadaceae bacterium]
MTTSPFTIGLIQQDVPDLHVGKTVERAITAIRKAAAGGAQIICLQELFTAPYFCKVTDAERFDLAEPIPGPTVERMQAVAKELAVVIVVPIFERRAAGLYHNSAAVVDADGSLLGVYRKMHIPDDPLYHEKYYFTPGEIYNHGEKAGQAAGFRIFETRYATIGVLICWDQWYPEAARITSLMGAQILCYPTAIGWHPSEKPEWGSAQVDAWRTIQRGHAIANGVYVAAVNRVGHEAEPGTDGLEFFGHSFVSDPYGRLIGQSETEADVLLATCDPAVIEHTRRNWPFLRDRRIDAYSPILSRYMR